MLVEIRVLEHLHHFRTNNLLPVPYTLCSQAGTLQALCVVEHVFHVPLVQYVPRRDVECSLRPTDFGHDAATNRKVIGRKDPPVLERFGDGTGEFAAVPKPVNDHQLNTTAHELLDLLEDIHHFLHIGICIGLEGIQKVQYLLQALDSLFSRWVVSKTLALLVKHFHIAASAQIQLQTFL